MGSTKGCSLEYDLSCFVLVNFKVNILNHGDTEKIFKNSVSLCLRG